MPFPPPIPLEQEARAAQHRDPLPGAVGAVLPDEKDQVRKSCKEKTTHLFLNNQEVVMAFSGRETSILRESCSGL